MGQKNRHSDRRSHSRGGTCGTQLRTNHALAGPRDFPPQGRLVDVDGSRMQIDCRGSGSPTVVFEAGLDMMGSLSWSAVHDAIAATTRACAYSRRGLMWSAARSGQFSADGIARDLHTLLVNAGERAPFVMVGHSLGGPYVMTFTRLFPQEVAGLVFVDASHPDQTKRMNLAIGKKLDTGDKLLKFANAVTWTGVPRAHRLARRDWQHSSAGEGRRGCVCQPLAGIGPAGIGSARCDVRGGRPSARLGRPAARGPDRRETDSAGRAQVIAAHGRTGTENPNRLEGIAR